MAQNYILLETIVLAQTTASVVFNNLPTSGYTDLKIVMSARNSGNDVDNIVTLNSTNKTSGIRLYGNGTNTASDTAVGGGLSTPSSATASTFSSTEYYFPNFLGTTQKTVSIDAVNETNGTSAFSNLSTQLFNLTSAVTSITLTPNTGSYIADSTFSLYGIAALGTTPTFAPKASGGNIVANDGTFWYHAFLTSGTFVPQANLTADVLVVAGGGGGGSGGGGGAGGLLAFTSQSLTLINYPVTVGAGGAGGVAYGNGSNGGNSQFAALTASVGGGGGGGANIGVSPPTGGSGGGAGWRLNNTGLPGGSGTPGQGNNGGAGGVNPGGYPGGGGGGAGAVGGNANTTDQAGAGGNGVSTYSSWGLATTTGQNISGTVWYAGGGGGSLYIDGSGSAVAGGNGGGGAGVKSASSSGNRGAANTGGGASGSVTDVGQPGGSGIVIIRYPIAS